MAVGSAQRIAFTDGSAVPCVTSAKYLGVIIDSKGDYTKEVSSRISSAAHAFKQLKPLWKSSAVPMERKLKIYRACVLPRMLYALGTAVLPQNLIDRLESRHASFVRRLCRIPTTWGAIKMGVPPLNNHDLLAAAGQDTIAS
eukprot:5291575-Alexandrium_andersonii.AAC.1